MDKALQPLAESLPADRNPYFVYLARLAPGSRSTMAQALSVVASILTKDRVPAEVLPWGQLRYQHVAAVRAALAERYSPAGANKVLSGLRGVIREAYRLGLMPGDDYTRAADVENVKGRSLPRGRALTQSDLTALAAACDSSTGQGARDSALIAILYGCGLRRAEATALDLSDFDTVTGELRVRSGKGRKARSTYLTNGAKRAVMTWLDVRGMAPGSLLCAVDKAGNVRDGHLTPGAVFQALVRLQQAAKVRPFSPHDCRRSYITDLLARGNSIATVQKLAGHASVVTTAAYDRSDESAKLRASESLHFPFVS